MTSAPTEADAQRAIIDLLARRDPGKTICPSEVARVLARGGSFRPLMGPVRVAAGQLADAGAVLVTQRGKPVDPRTARGPIRIGAASC